MAAERSWIDVLAELRSQRRPCAMVVVTAVRGSAPREVGARMIVADGRLVWGTIGGGNLERQAIERCGELLGEGRAVAETIEFPLAERGGQCCGGAVSLFIETHPWTRRRVVVFGAGHVGQALGGLAPYLGADVLLVDSREPEELQPPLPEDPPYELLTVDAPEEELDGLPRDAAVLIMTHSHALDLELVARALSREPFAYLGLIGSERKWAQFRKRLLRRGFDQEQLGRVRCPIGVTRGSKEPQAIALSAAAELVEVFSSLEIERG